jgi:hypothetical protein
MSSSCVHLCVLLSVHWPDMITKGGKGGMKCLNRETSFGRLSPSSQFGQEISP